MRPRGRDVNVYEESPHEAVCNQYRFTVLTFEYFLGARVQTIFIPPRPMFGERNIPGSIALEECRFV